MRQMSTPKYRWEKRGSKRWRDLCKGTELEEVVPLPGLVPALPLTCCIMGLELALCGPLSIWTRKARLDLLYRLRWTFVYLPAWPAFFLKQKHPPRLRPYGSRNGHGIPISQVTDWFKMGM